MRDTQAGGFGTLTVRAGTGDDAIAVFNSRAYSLSAAGEAGNDRVLMNNARATFLTAERGTEDDAIAVFNSRAYSLDVLGGVGNDAINMFNNNAYALQADGGDGHDWIVLSYVTGTDNFHALGGAGNDRIALRKSGSNYLNVSAGADRDLVFLSGVTAGHLGLDGGAGTNGLHLDHVTRTTEQIGNFQYRY